MIEITNTTNYRVPRQFILKTLKHSISYLQIKNPVLSVVFVMPATIKKLNLNYRHKNKITDVLSFSYQYDKNNLEGEIIICYSVAVQQAKEFKYSTRQEISRLLIHSLLHLIKYDHDIAHQAKKMEALENDIIKYLRKKI